MTSRLKEANRNTDLEDPLSYLESLLNTYFVFLMLRSNSYENKLFTVSEKEHEFIVVKAACDVHVFIVVFSASFQVWTFNQKKKGPPIYSSLNASSSLLFCVE